MSESRSLWGKPISSREARGFEIPCLLCEEYDGVCEHCHGTNVCPGNRADGGYSEQDCDCGFRAMDAYGSMPDW